MIDPSNIRLSISSNSAVLYTYNDFRGSKDSRKHRYTDNFLKVRTDNYLSVSGGRKIKKAINWLVSTSREKRIFSKEMNKYVRYRLTFITLTLPCTQFHDDNEIKKECLQVFLQWMRDKFNAKKVVWRAEIQENGNIHFHITLDKFIHYKEVQKQWNRNLEKLGYVSKFAEKFGHWNPPTTHIKAVKKAKELAAYLAAYLGSTAATKGKKQYECYHSRVISGRLYGVSSYLSGIKGFSVSADVGCFFDVLRKLRKGCNKVLSKEYATIFVFDSVFLKRFLYYLKGIYGNDFLIDCNLSRDDLNCLLI